jgi:hypothetical protein
MPTRLPWEPRFGVGHELVDAQHREMLDQCNRLADLCAGGDEADRQFDQASGPKHTGWSLHTAQLGALQMNSSARSHSCL